MPLFYHAKESDHQPKMLSFQHVVIIFIVALVVFGPQKLPELARTLGKLTNEFRKATSEIRSSFEDQMRDLEREAAVIEAKKRRIAAEQRAATLRAGTTPSAETPDAIIATPSSTEPVVDRATAASLPQGDGDSASTTAQPVAGNGGAPAPEMIAARQAASEADSPAPQNVTEKPANA